MNDHKNCPRARRVRRALREASAGKIAHALGVHRTTVMRWARGEHRVPYAVDQFLRVVLAEED